MFRTQFLLLRTDERQCEACHCFFPTSSQCLGAWEKYTLGSIFPVLFIEWISIFAPEIFNFFIELFTNICDSGKASFAMQTLKVETYQQANKVHKSRGIEQVDTYFTGLYHNANL
jgi:hypothetical protein